MAPKLKELKPGKEMDGAVIKRLHQILKNADLEKTTVKNIQKQLEVATLGQDFVGYFAWVWFWQSSWLST